MGKTIQIISFIASLFFSKKLNGPVLIVCPATVLRQWVQEFHSWWPPLRVAVLHSLGSAFTNSQVSFFDHLEDSDEEAGPKRKTVSDTPVQSAGELIESIKKQGHILITTYFGMRQYREELLKVKWAYAILDEGHKIRNPDADITITCKQLKTCHRIILSGTPIQNNLIELWSLFDFVFPGKLGVNCQIFILWLDSSSVSDSVCRPYQIRRIF